MDKGQGKGSEPSTHHVNATDTRRPAAARVVDRADDDDDADEVAAGPREPPTVLDWEAERDAEAIREVETSSKKRQKCARAPVHGLRTPLLHAHQPWLPLAA